MDAGGIDRTDQNSRCLFILDKGKAAPFLERDTAILTYTVDYDYLADE